MGNIGSCGSQLSDFDEKNKTFHGYRKLFVDIVVNPPYSAIPHFTQNNPVLILKKIYVWQFNIIVHVKKKCLQLSVKSSAVDII